MAPSPRRLPILQIPPQQVVRRIETLADAKAVAGELGEPSKMPGYAYGISAQLCNVGGRLRDVPGSVCSKCFALTGWYRSWRPLLIGHALRERGIRHPLWVDAMVLLINHYCVGEHAYFRFHDSGDIRGLWHLVNIAEVCRRTPGVRHWLPTREYDVVAAFLAAGNTIPDNLTIRLSAHMIDCEPVVPDAIAHLPTSTVSTISLLRSEVKITDEKGAIECRAPDREGTCGGCRACWNRRVTTVNYAEH